MVTVIVRDVGKDTGGGGVSHALLHIDTTHTLCLLTQIYFHHCYSPLKLLKSRREECLTFW